MEHPQCWADDDKFSLEAVKQKKSKSISDESFSDHNSVARWRSSKTLNGFSQKRLRHICSKYPLFDLLNVRNENGPKTIAGKRLENDEINCRKVIELYQKNKFELSESILIILKRSKWWRQSSFCFKKDLFRKCV